MSSPDRTNDVVVAVDVGGTKLAVGLVGPDGSVRGRWESPTPNVSAEATMAALAALVGQATDAAEAARERPIAVGVGCGGPMAPGGVTVSPLNIGSWRDFPLRQALRDLTGLSVWIDNDAKALALGEGWVGAARGQSDFAALVVSTGVGGGLVVDGRLLDGASGNAGHLGHINVVPDGAACGCGARGCLEAECSGLHIQRRIGRPPVDADDATRRRTGRLVGHGLAAVANLCDVTRFFVAGSVALGFGDVFFEEAARGLAERARLDFSASASVSPAGLGSLGPIVGAAAVAHRALDWAHVDDVPGIAGGVPAGVS